MGRGSIQTRPAIRPFPLFLGLTLGIEAVIVFFRFGLGLEAARDTAGTIGALTGGLRIHHGYIGILIVLAAAGVWRKRPQAAPWLLAVGLALVCSDLIHHFLVLWPVTGSPEFHLTY